MSAVADLRAAGVAIWLDDLSRGLIESGTLARLVDAGIVSGVTTNPTIFARAVLSEDTAYRRQIGDLASRGVHGEEAQRALVLTDVRRAADILLPVHESSHGGDGFVSVEANPRLSHDAAATAAEATYLQWAVDRPNVMVKIPATAEGLAATTAALSMGISVNVTLIFGPQRYRQVLDAWLDGLELAMANGQPLEGISCAASIFVSRVDAFVDRELDRLGATDRLGGQGGQGAQGHPPLKAAALHGCAAIADARMVWRVFEEMRRGSRWQALEGAGARLQTPVWASMGVKNPTYSPTRYVVELVGDPVVMTLPRDTLEATLALRRIPAMSPAMSISRPGVEEVWRDLESLGINADEVALQLERDGLDAFVASWAELGETVDAAARGSS